MLSIECSVFPFSVFQFKSTTWLELAQFPMTTRPKKVVFF